MEIRKRKREKRKRNRNFQRKKCEMNKWGSKKNGLIYDKD